MATNWSRFPMMGPREGPVDQNQWDHDDWAKVFDAPYNADPPTWHAAVAPPAPATEPITPEDVAEVTHFRASAYEEYADQAMTAVMRLKDGRWATVDTWSDSSGYGCRDGTAWFIGATFEDVVRWGLEDADRKTLGIEQPT